MTAFLDTLQKSESLLLISSDSGCSVRQTSTSGWMPISRSFWTECCVGFVFSSPLARRYGISVRWTNATCSRPTSSANWRIASRNGSPSMSPTVPPISQMSTSASPTPRLMPALISSVMCGITWTVLPR